MGDRGNIALKDDTDKLIYFYTHWSGSDLPKTLQTALIRGRDRWTDPPYLARIIFSEMIKENVMDTSGFGISHYIQDNEHPIITVDLENRTVERKGVTYTFEQYIKCTLK